MKKLTLLKSMLLLCALIAGNGSVWATDVWVKTDLTNITSGDYVVVVEVENAKAMTNNNGTSSAPSASAVTLNTAKTIITGEVATTIQFVITKTANGFNLSKPSTTNYVYTTTSNNGIRVGTGTNREFIPCTNSDKNYVGYKINDGTNDRYFGCYNNSDWRSYTSVNSNIQNESIYLFKKYTSVTATVNSTYNWSTFSSIVPLDFTGISDLTAYKVESVSTTSATLVAVTGKVAENTGLLLNGATTTIPVATSATPFSSSENKLVAVSSAKTLTSADKAYVLTVDGGGNVIFGKVGATDANIAAGQAYLDGSDVSANQLSFDFGSGEATGIEEVKDQKASFFGNFYSISGQRVAQPTKGLYIVNGKKVIIK